MIGIDTSVLVRLFVQDDADQCLRVDFLLQSLSFNNPGFVPSVALVELSWILRNRCGVSKLQFISRVQKLLDLPEIVLEQEAALRQTIHRFGNTNADFAGCLIERICFQTGCARTVPFDADAAKSSGMVLV